MIQQTVLQWVAFAAIAAPGGTLESGKYEWIFELNGQSQRTACVIERDGDTFVIKAGPKDPIRGSLKDGEFLFEINNNANSMKGVGKVGKDGWVRGEMSWGQGGVALAKGSFVFAPRNTPEQMKAIEEYFKSNKPKLKLPSKAPMPMVKSHARQEFADSLGTMKIDAPRLGGKLTLVEKRLSPATKLFRFEFDGGDTAVCVSTMLRDGPKDDNAVVRVEPRYKRTQEMTGADRMRVAVVGKAPNRRLEYSILNVVDNPTFPLTLAPKQSDELANATVSHVFVRSGRFIELTILMKNYEAEAEDAFVKRLHTICSKWRETLAAD